MKEIQQRYKNRKEATKRLRLWHAGMRRGVEKARVGMVAHGLFVNAQHFCLH